MTKILVLSDTHGFLTNEIENIIKESKPDCLIHCGDHNFDENFAKQFDILIQGNMDLYGEEFAKVKVENINILCFHGDQVGKKGWNSPFWYDKIHLLGQEAKADIVFFGHNHRPYVKLFEEDKMVIANPGSLAKPFDKDKTYSFYEIVVDKDKFEIFPKKYKTKKEMDLLIEQESKEVELKLTQQFQLISTRGKVEYTNIFPQLNDMTLKTMPYVNIKDIKKAKDGKEILKNIQSYDQKDLKNLQSIKNDKTYHLENTNFQVKYLSIDELEQECKKWENDPKTIVLKPFDKEETQKRYAQLAADKSKGGR